MAIKLRTMPGTASNTVGGSGPFVGDFVLVTNTGKVWAMIGGDDESCFFPLRPNETIQFPIGDSEYIYCKTSETDASAALFFAGLQSV